LSIVLGDSEQGEAMTGANSRYYILASEPVRDFLGRPAGSKYVTLLRAARDSLKVTCTLGEYGDPRRYPQLQFRLIEVHKLPTPDEPPALAEAFWSGLIAETTTNPGQPGTPTAERGRYRITRISPVLTIR
jgi:hypothetical protein